MPFGGQNSNGGQRKKKIAIIGTSALILVAMVVAVAVGFNRSESDSQSAAPTSPPPSVSTTTKAIQAICQPTDYRETCENSLTSAAGNTSDPKELIKAAFNVAIDHISAAIRNSSTLKELAKDSRTNQALSNCDELLKYAIDDLKESFDRIGPFEYEKLDEYVDDLKIWLSGAITYEQTCLDGFENTTGEAGLRMKAMLRSSQELTSNGLAMVTEISSILASYNLPFNVSRRLLSSEDGDDTELSWLSDGKRRLLQATGKTIKADVVVAKDGSGKYRTVNEALKDIPKKGNKTFVIYIKQGVYKEQVMFAKSMTHVMIIGDGPTKTRITGSLNFIDGVQTFKTATVSVIGSNFIAKDIGFENSAGPQKHQAVALRVQSDMSIFYNCHMDGYQDTLYAHTHRQFYRDCVITGTIDFIFGDSAAVFQNCKMVIRKPLDNQNCIVTAQGRTERREATALVLQNCTITGDPAYLPVKDQNKGYLGRPWKEFSRTIIMNSRIDDVIAPEGWLPWAGDFALNTCFYTEILNRGPGSKLDGRVKWRGIKKVPAQRAVEYTPGRFIRGDWWIKAAGVPYVSGMLNV
ncbi:Putative pectinesterase/pectinesterase inhibitor 28 [Morus notabilis]|uniref:Pectinesterase n=1 Tax=Morus notabilis TaxID=981085 RepID=W9S1C5_9ROSA|nr:putative pectinesterase/pectinesterase inhibitor 28 [Morus notabilis]EXC03939.1 Putative pectinesterase/pectinesterase inhibitor 28 [Morus notabilis]